MSYKIAVCVKHVPHPDYFSRVKLDPKTGTIIRTGIPSVVNPLDRHALEVALSFKDKYGGSVTAVSMGPPPAREALEVALAMGADEAVLLTDRKFAGADSLLTAEILAKGLKEIASFDLVVCGDFAVDGSTGQVPAQLAEYLGYPHLAHVQEIALENGKLKAKTTRETGYAVYQAQLPVVIAVNKHAGVPRNMTVPGIMKAVKYDLKMITADKIRLLAPNALEGSPTRVQGMTEVKGGRKALILTGEPADSVKKAIEHLKKVGAL
ncbi:MAG: electron transfer flavoprotein subunit beta/FixA family protein [Peptococcaceae bacterium]|jgi:electron transfer flavoprotein beta subunit|nr:electron transfer flavoprotein subunit beta/FixA family protein [Peptococcaceae bacterium]MDH7524380.1 electron transfer flavoprotein subunit beta/FixA family protein [Peptococcaceae bacterium]